MSFQVLTGNPAELDAAASRLAAVADAMVSLSREVGGLPEAAQHGGVNALAKGMHEHIAMVTPILDQAAADSRRAQALLVGLRQTLDGYDMRAAAAKRRHDDAMQHLATQPLALVHEAQMQNAMADAQRARALVAGQLKRLAEDTPTYRAAHPGFWHDLFQIGKDTVTGAYHLVKGTAGLTIEWAWNPKGAQHNWANLIAGADYVAHHKAQTGKQLWNAVARPDLLKSDPAAWVVGTGLLLIPIAGEVGAGAKLAAAAGRLGEGVRALTAVDGLAAVGRLGSTGRLLIDSGIAESDVMVLSEDGAAYLGATVKGSVWDLHWLTRGKQLEQAYTEMMQAEDPSIINLNEIVPNHKTVDLWRISSPQTIESVKSIDPAAASYQTPSQFRSTVKGLFDHTARYMPDDPSPLQASDIEMRQVTVLLPDTEVQSWQVDVLRDLKAQYEHPTDPALSPIKVVFVEVPR